MPVLHAAARTLERVPPTQQGKHRLELAVLFKALKSWSQDAVTVTFGPRAQKIVEADPESADVFMRMDVVVFTEQCVNHQCNVRP